MSRVQNSAKVRIRMILIGEQVGATSFDYSAFPVVSSCSLFWGRDATSSQAPAPFPSSGFSASVPLQVYGSLSATGIQTPSGLTSWSCPSCLAVVLAGGAGLQLCPSGGGKWQHTSPRKKLHFFFFWLFSECWPPSLWPQAVAVVRG